MWGDYVYIQAHLEAGLGVSRHPANRSDLTTHRWGRDFWLQIFWRDGKDHSRHWLHGRNGIKFPLDSSDPCQHPSLPRTPSPPSEAPIYFLGPSGLGLQPGGSLSRAGTGGGLSGGNLFIATQCAPCLLIYLLIWLSVHPGSHSYCCPVGWVSYSNSIQPF